MSLTELNLLLDVRAEKPCGEGGGGKLTHLNLGGWRVDSAFYFV